MAISSYTYTYTYTHTHTYVCVCVCIHVHINKTIYVDLQTKASYIDMRTFMSSPFLPCYYPALEWMQGP
jgi:hypothetical protein